MLPAKEAVFVKVKLGTYVETHAPGDITFWLLRPCAPKATGGREEGHCIEPPAASGR